MRVLVACAVVLAVLGWTQAVQAEPTLYKGRTIIAVQLTDGPADLSFTSNDFVSAYAHSEMGVQAQLWHLVSNDWAITAAGGIGFFKETDEPTIFAAAGTPNFKYSQKSFQVRLGIDRVVHLTDEVHLLAGPGIQYWSGDQTREFENAPGSKVTSTKTHRIALSGRLGMHIKLANHFGLLGQIGSYLGHATAKEDGGKASWWPSGTQGSMGIAFHF